jgi:hypothetical protein
MNARRARHRIDLARASTFLALAASTAAALPQGQEPIDPEPIEAPYAELDNVGGSFVNLATFPVRPMLYDPSGNLWAVNHHDSTIERFVGLTQDPDKVYGVPWSPVAIAWWNGDGGAHGSELLVVCRGTWAVVGIDPATGKPTRLLQLRPGTGALPGGLDARIGRMAEPGDILVDETNDRAFVSCTGADTVVQIDLAANTVVRAFNQEADPTFRIKSPLFLSWDLDGTSVLCAPMHSGNNSSALPGLITSTEVQDLTPQISGDIGLPDEDLFRITPFVNTSNPGSVQVVITGLGTIQFAHKLHPTNFDFWQLNTDANNTKGQTEPEVKGVFADNRVSIVANTSTTWGTTVNAIELDPGDLSGAITTANTVGQPFALEFNAAGNAFIAGLLTDNVLVLDQNGGYLMEWDLPDGSIPRGLLRHPSLIRLMAVYCWGDNRVRVYQIDTTAGTATPRVTYRLRHDPTPTNLVAGRKEFFDASHSADQNVSCATCHVEGGNDFLTWNLSNGPVEEKGPMFTQTLVGLERLAPFHWRGERQLDDFRPAFQGLLGAAEDDGNGTSEPGEEPDDTEFARFEDFVFSLRNPANPNQHRRRVLRVDIHHHDTNMDGVGEDPPPHASNANGNAIHGQTEFGEPDFVNVGRHSCLDCHGFPTGTNNEINVEQEGGAVPRRGSMKPAPFHENWRKHQSLVKVIQNGTPRFPAFLGSGFAHTGELGDMFRFVSLVTDDTGLADEIQTANNKADFMHQWDQGLAPAVHFAYLLDAAANATTTNAEVGVYLPGEMTKGNCDIAVVGMVSSGGNLVARRWAWDRVAAAYVCEDPAFSNRQLSAFSTGATSSGESNLFLGLPLGMAERFAIDYDMDGVRNLDATEVGHAYDPTQPGWDNGLTPALLAGSPQILWESTKVARLVFTTNEPTTAVIAYDEPKTPAHSTASPLLSRHHSVMLTGMRPSTDPFDGNSVTEYVDEAVTYSVTITLTDATGNPAAQTPFNVTTDPFIVPAELLLGVGGPMQPFGAEKRNQRTSIVQAICLGGPQCDDVTQQTNGDWRMQVDLTLALKRGEWQIPSGGSDYEPVRAQNRVVVGRALVERASGELETAHAAGLTVTPVGGSAHLADDVKFLNTIGLTSSLMGISAPPGPLLAGTDLSDANGHSTLTFDVNPTSSLGSTEDLASGDRLVFVVEAVIELDTGIATPIITTGLPALLTYRTHWRGTFMEWSFPDTKEARSAIRSAPL